MRCRERVRAPQVYLLEFVSLARLVGAVIAFS
jgi:hypothetical protein